MINQNIISFYILRNVTFTIANGTVVNLIIWSLLRLTKTYKDLEKCIAVKNNTVDKWRDME